MNGFITRSDGVIVPAPMFEGTGMTIRNKIFGEDNALGEFKAFSIGPAKLTITLKFPYLNPKQFSDFLRMFDARFENGALVGTFTVYDPALMDFRTARMYIGDRVGIPINMDALFKPTGYTEIAATLTEV